MKLQVTQENLAKALNNVARVANTRGTLPILANVMLKTVGTRLTIAATNLDIAITHYIGSKVGEEGSITVPARLMQDFVTSLPSGVIELKLDDYKLHITTDQYNSTINGVSAEEFPVMPAISEGKSWTVPVKDLKQALQQVLVAAGTDESRPVLTGVYLHSNDGKLYIASTDSYRLAEKEFMTTKEDIQLLIPASALQDLLRLLSDQDDSVEITHDDQQVLFKVGEVELVTRLIEGSYPDYRKLIPTSFASEATLSKSDFVNITKVSSLFARESAGSITIHLDAEQKQVSIKSIASQLGENTASATADVVADGSITLNSRFLLDALGTLSADKVQIRFNGKLEPCVLQELGGDDYTHVIMPLKS
ncbi:DNA polymerase III subunit beta [Candidatus Saccharibacteria bacterium]|nr:MAG: DNA polymerase III subunit beta [Candidatus Saccharibacteria bacterium]